MGDWLRSLTGPAGTPGEAGHSAGSGLAELLMPKYHALRQQQHEMGFEREKLGRTEQREYGLQALRGQQSQQDIETQARLNAANEAARQNLAHQLGASERARQVTEMMMKSGLDVPGSTAQAAGFPGAFGQTPAFKLDLGQLGVQRGQLGVAQARLAAEKPLIEQQTQKLRDENTPFVTGMSTMPAGQAGPPRPETIPGWAAHDLIQSTMSALGGEVGHNKDAKMDVFSPEGWGVGVRANMLAQQASIEHNLGDPGDPETHQATATINHAMLLGDGAQQQISDDMVRNLLLHGEGLPSATAAELKKHAMRGAIVLTGAGQKAVDDAMSGAYDKLRGKPPAGDGQDFTAIHDAREGAGLPSVRPRVP